MNALLVVAVSMILAHEGAHVLVNRLLGGQFRRVVFRGLAVGVELIVTGLSPTAVAWTLIAGPLAEALVAGAAAILAPPGRCVVAAPAGGAVGGQCSALGIFSQ
nr:M50 family metallopeptidase [Sulfobacillus thermotolerans]